MQGKTKNLVWCIVPMLCLLCSLAHAQEQNSSAGAALSSMFNVQKAPKAKSMGIFQANFLDSIKTADRTMQLAIAVDSTQSMSEELNGIREGLPLLFSDIHRIQDGAVEATVVSYSDVGDSEMPVTIVSPSFVKTPEHVVQLIKNITATTGKPYFPEPVDLGLYTAINQLEWSDDENVEKWILLIGDAPPYDPTYADQKTSAKRWYDTEFLIDLANKNNIKIHSLLCASRPQEKEAYEKSLAKTRRFMSQVSGGTGGQMLDLSYPYVREQLVASAAPSKKTEYKRIGYVTQTEIDAIREEIDGAAADENQVIRIAVLPFIPFDSMTFFYERPEVQFATELRQLLRSMPNVRTIPTRQIEDQITRLQGQGVPLKDWPQALNLRLRSDFVLHGELRIGDSAFAEAHVYGREQSDQLMRLATSGPINQLASSLLSNFAQAQQQAPEALRPLAQRLSELELTEEGAEPSIAMLQDLNETERSQLLGGFEALHQALEYPQGDPEGEQLLVQAEEELQGFLNSRPEHAFAHVLMASCLYNRAKLEESNGQLDVATNLRERAVDSIKAAHRLRSQLVDRLTRYEVEGDYALMVAQNYSEAIEWYKQIINFSEASPVQPALRAHWMLAGIYNGAWGVGKNNPDIVEPEKAKHHLLRILAYWPDSVEARAIKRYLLWDEEKDRSRTPYVPVQGDLLTSTE